LIKADLESIPLPETELSSSCYDTSGTTSIIGAP
jgi:hypothetical protein